MTLISLLVVLFILQLFMTPNHIKGETKKHRNVMADYCTKSWVESWFLSPEACDSLMMLIVFGQVCHRLNWCCASATASGLLASHSAEGQWASAALSPAVVLDGRLKGRLPWPVASASVCTVQLIFNESCLLSGDRAYDASLTIRFPSVSTYGKSSALLNLFWTDGFVSICLAN